MQLSNQNVYHVTTYATTYAFSIFHKDRPTPGAGVLAYVKDSIPTKQLQHFEATD